MPQSQYLVEPHAPWFPGWREKDIVVATTDLDALQQARQRCAAGAVFRYSSTYQRNSWTLVYVAPFFAWQVR